VAEEPVEAEVAAAAKPTGDDEPEAQAFNEAEEPVEAEAAAAANAQEDDDPDDGAEALGLPDELDYCLQCEIRIASMRCTGCALDFCDRQVCAHHCCCCCAGCRADWCWLLCCSNASTRATRPVALTGTL
jgi:hypothetical protein